MRDLYSRKGESFMTKRLLAVCLAAILTLPLVGCDKNEPPFGGLTAEKKAEKKGAENKTEKNNGKKDEKVRMEKRNGHMEVVREGEASDPFDSVKPITKGDMNWGISFSNIDNDALNFQWNGMTVRYELNSTCIKKGPALDGEYRGYLDLNYSVDLGQWGEILSSLSDFSYDFDGWGIADDMKYKLVKYNAKEVETFENKKREERKAVMPKTPKIDTGMMPPGFPTMDPDAPIHDKRESKEYKDIISNAVVAMAYGDNLNFNRKDMSGMMGLNFGSIFNFASVFDDKGATSETNVLGKHDSSNVNQEVKMPWVILLYDDGHATFTLISHESKFDLVFIGEWYDQTDAVGIYSDELPGAENRKKFIEDPAKKKQEEQQKKDKK